VEGSRISGVGEMDSLSGEELLGPVVDAGGGHVLPGFIDAHCHLGFSAHELNEDDPCTPQLRALDGVDPMDEYFAKARRAGVTCVLTGPGSASPIAGQMVAVKTAGTVIDQMAVRHPAAMKFALGENPVKGKAGPQTRMGVAALIREELKKAAEYGQRLEQAERDGGDGPDLDGKLAALAPVAAGRVPAHFHAHRADDIATAVRIAKEFGLDLVVVHGTDGPLIADFLAREGVPVITGPSMTDKSKPELKNLAMENTAALAKAGVQVAICTDHPETPIQYLLLCAALAARAGMDEEEALAAITISAACIAGVDDRLGSLTIGKDADIVLMSGHPFEFKSRVQRVWIDGREVTQ
jgi:imidazolonepropionase-like amidohydrolase